MVRLSRLAGTVSFKALRVKLDGLDFKSTGSDEQSALGSAVLEYCYNLFCCCRYHSVL